MTSAVAAAVAAGSLVVIGLLFLARGMIKTPPKVNAQSAESVGGIWARMSRRPPGAKGRRRDICLLASVLIGFLVTVLTGWIVALVLIPVVVLGLPYLLVVPKPRDVELLEALDRWVRAMSATLATGKSITDAIRISRRTAPPVLAEEVGVLVTRLNNRWETRDALLRFADAIDSPDADGVIASLILASNRGANGASTTLQALADSIQAQLKSRRIIEIERSKPYVVVRQVTVITMVAMLVIVVLSPGYFAPYGTPLGQALLSVLLLMYFGSLLLMRRKAQQRPRQRILVSDHR